MSYLPEVSEGFREAKDVPAARELAKHQHNDFEAISVHFRAAGTEVEYQITKKGS